MKKTQAEIKDYLETKYDELRELVSKYSDYDKSVSSASMLLLELKELSEEILVYQVANDDEEGLTISFKYELDSMIYKLYLIVEQLRLRECL